MIPRSHITLFSLFFFPIKSFPNITLYQVEISLPSMSVHLSGCFTFSQLSEPLIYKTVFESKIRFKIVSDKKWGGESHKKFCNLPFIFLLFFNVLFSTLRVYHLVRWYGHQPSVKCTQHTIKCTLLQPFTTTMLL